MIDLTDYENENEFITIFDDDGLITIQMSEKSVIKIIETFDGYINSKKDIELEIFVLEFDEKFMLKFKLINSKIGFSLTCSKNGINHYNNFELEFCDIETWKMIKNRI